MDFSVCHDLLVFNMIIFPNIILSEIQTLVGLGKVNHSICIFIARLNNVFNDCVNPENYFDGQLVKIL